MAVTADQVREVLGGSQADMAEIEKCLALAIVWVDKYLEDNEVEVGAGTDDVPAVVYDEAVLLVASDEFGRRRAPNGVLNQQYQSEDGVQNVPVRISRDPLAAAYAPLSPWVGIAVGGA